MKRCLIVLGVVVMVVMPWSFSARPAAAIDCFSFDTQAQAQAILNALPNDPYGLDEDQNGIACDTPKGAAEILATAAANQSHAPQVPNTSPSQPPPDVLSQPVTIVSTAIGHTGVEVDYHEADNQKIVVTSVLSGIDAPRPAGAATQYRPGFTGPECYNAEAQQELNHLLPEGATAYIEGHKSGGASGSSRAAYVWINGDQGYQLVNEVLVRDGAAVVGFSKEDLDKSTFLPFAESVRYQKRLEQAQAAAMAEGAGLWGACG